MGVGSPWIGGFQPPGSPEPAGGWQWVTGEPFVYANWAAGEPNDTGGTEDGIEFFSGPGTWNDIARTDLKPEYIVEYDLPLGPFLNPANGHYYEAIPAPNGIDWFAADAVANSLTFQGVPGHLATITSQGENDFIANEFLAPGVGDHWIGGFQPAGSPEPDSGWQWVTGEPFVYTNWELGEPNNAGGTEDGIEILPGSGMWNDIDRTVPRPAYIVEYDTFLGPVLNPANLHWYEVVSSLSAIDWFGADADANSLTFQGVQGHLATITSQGENDFVADNLLVGLGGVGGHWIGGFQPAGSPEPAGGWQWVTGEPFVYTSWDVGEPNDTGGTEDGIEFLPGPAKWNDAARTDLMPGYVVEYDTACTLDLALSYAAGTLTMDFLVGTMEPVTGNAWLSAQNTTVLLGSIPIPVIVPPTAVSFPVPVAQQGTIGVLATMTTPSEGIICSTWVTVDTGPAPGT